MAEQGPSQELWKSREAFLEVFFYGVSQFMFDQAKELVDKEKEATKFPASIWLQLCSVLTDLVSAEKLYSSLTYIERRLLRRDLVRPLYDKLQTDLKRLELTGEASLQENSDITEAMASDLAKQLSQFISARKEMIDFYIKMAKNRWENKESEDQLVKLIDNIIERHNNEFHHPILDSLKTGFSFEAEIVQCLCKAEVKMQQWDFFSSLLLLYQCQTDLNSWTQLVVPGTVREIAAQTTAKSPASMIASRKSWHAPTLYRWLYQVQLAAISKFSLYFHSTLSSQTNQAEMKLLTAKTTVDYFAKITTFIRKSEAFNVSLILDTTTMDHVAPGHGYFLPNIEHERRTGKDTYPAIVSLLEPQPTSHWPNVISILIDRAADLAHPGRIVYYFDDKVGSTYYIIKVDVRVFLLVIFNVKKKERDSHISKFMTETRSLLTYERNYQMLKPRQVQKFRN
ncbi:KICSTOR subunit 2-like [Rhopilema esculentum]|uniref:KICSTOR subunit 2-like n=1 Tax=Rhopilema esculentum TaxID=499914 RepID=UPI0031D0A834